MGRKYITWSNAELQMLRDVSLSHRNVADKTGRSYSAVKAKRKVLDIVAEKKDINYWGIGEISVIKNNPHLSNPEFAKILNKTVQAVQLKRSKLGLYAPSDIWAEDELYFLNKNYHTMAKKEIAAHIKRSETAIMSKAFELGITAKKEYWSKKELTILKEKISLSNKELCALIYKTEKQIAYKKAYLNTRSKKVIDPSIYNELDNDVLISYNSKSDRYADLLEAMNINQSFEFPTAELVHIQMAKNIFSDRIFKIKKQDDKTSRLWRIM